METKKCSNCGKFMIECQDNILFGKECKNVYHFKCACGNTEFSKIEESEETCKWEDKGRWDESTHNTQCYKYHVFESGSIETNQYKFCTYCSKEIEEVKNGE